MQSLIDDPFTRFLAQVVTIIALSRLIGLAARRLGQPMVIAEMIAGILLGPSLLGWLFPELSTALFAADSLHALGTVSQVGLVLFMFLIGLELDHRLLRGRGRASLAISYTGILAPFVLTGLLAAYLHPRFSGSEVPLTRFTLFMGASMGITAFPVLARILTEQRLLRSRVGAMTIACAAVSDVTAWCILAFVVAGARATGLTDALVTTALAIGFVVFMTLVARPALVKVVTRVATPEAMSQNLVAVVLVLVLVSSWLTELIGIHALFGAFLFGAILPKEGGFARALAEKLEDLVVIAFLPLFFAYSGLRTEIGLLNSGLDWAVCGLIILVATLSKAGTGAIAARLSGMSWREAGALGVLMNTRGLMGVIALNIGLDLGVISPALFSMMIIMALVTTLVATPALQRIYPAEEMARDLVASLEPTSSPAAAEYRMLVCVARAESAAGLIEVARALQGTRGDARVYALHLVPASERPWLQVTDDDSVPGALRAALARARELDVEVRPLSFVSPDPADDICRVATVRETDLVLLGCRRASAGQGALGDFVWSVMEGVRTTVAVLVDRGLDGPRRIVVPLRGTPHDEAALKLARRVADGAGCSMTVVPEGEALGLLPAGLTGDQLVVAGIGDGAEARACDDLVRNCAASLLLVRGSRRATARATEA